MVLKTGQPGLIAELCSAELAHALDVPVPRCRMIVRGDREHSSMLDGIQRAVEEADSPCKRVVTKMASEPLFLKYKAYWKRGDYADAFVMAALDATTLPIADVKPLVG